MFLLQLSNALVVPNHNNMVKPTSTTCFTARTNPGEELESSSHILEAKVSRRDTLAAALSTAAIFSSVTSSSKVAVADDEGRLIQFDVANLDGVEGNTGSFTIQTHPSWAPRGAQRFEVS
jgi:hypothetical protein